MLNKAFSILLSIALIMSGQSCTQSTGSISSQETIETPKIKNVILLIGDGMGIAQITSGLIANKNRLNLEKTTHVGLIKTSSGDKLITDSAAGGTAFSAGKKTYNGAIGVDMNQAPVKNIVELASEQNLATGVISTSSITHATPASFYSHVTSRKMEEEIAADLVNSEIDLFMGGGKNFFAARSDEKDLLQALQENGFTIASDIQGTQNFQGEKLAYLAADGALPPKHEGRDDFLPLATENAIDFLSQNEEGFFLMVEGSQIDWGGHANNTEYVAQEMIDFDLAIGKALEFASENQETLVVITADHETGGMAVTGGNVETGEVEAKYSSGGHTPVLIPVFSYGPAAESFSGIYENTAIFDKIKSAYNWVVN